MSKDQTTIFNATGKDLDRLAEALGYPPRSIGEPDDSVRERLITRRVVSMSDGTISVSEPSLAGTIGPLPTWIDELRYRVARERGVDPMSLACEVVRVCQEDGMDCVDVRFTSK